MNHSFKSLVTLSILTTAASATVTLNVNFGGMFTNTPGTILPSNSIAVIVASGTDSIFPQGAALEGFSLSQYANWGGDDSVVAVFASIQSTIDGATVSRILGSSATIDYSNSVLASKTIGPSDKIAVYWFPAIFDTNSASGLQGPLSQSTITAGIAYGFYTSSLVANLNASSASIHTSNNAFILPSDGSSNFRVWSLNTDGLTTAQETTSVSNNPSASDYTANLIVPVPEPSTYALMGLGLVVVGLIARRKKA